VGKGLVGLVVDDLHGLRLNRLESAIPSPFLHRPPALGGDPKHFIKEVDHSPHLGHPHDRAHYLHRLSILRKN